MQKIKSMNSPGFGSLKQTLDNVERRLIMDALNDVKGNMCKASKILGLTERQMGLRVRKYGINLKMYKKNRGDG